MAKSLDIFLDRLSAGCGGRERTWRRTFSGGEVLFWGLELRVHGLRGLEVQGFRGFRGSDFQGFRSLEVPAFRGLGGLGVEGFRGLGHPKNTLSI